MSTYSDIISCHRKGFSAGATRSALHALSLPYRGGVALRNWFYDRILTSHRLECPCISVGNLTTGGTGKTPLVVWLATELIRSGRKVAIISRGYKSDHHGPDELRLVSDLCPEAICVAHPDRVQAGQYVVEEHHVDIVILDDAFQHRRIERDLDIVLLDASCPFGFGYVLPRGLLRESQAGLRRADVIILTRLSQTTPQDLAPLKDRCRKLNPEAVIIGCDHRPVQLVDPEGISQDLAALNGRPTLAFAGIGNPGSFAHTLEQLGARPMHVIALPDHHRYTAADCERISRTSQQAGAELLVTTQKDMVKLRELEYDWPLPLLALCVTIDFVGNGAGILLETVDQLFTEDPYEDGENPLPTD